MGDNKELELKKLELEIKLQEIEIRERENSIKRKNKINHSILIAVIGGILGVLGTLFNSWLQHENNGQIERQKLNSSLILKAIETDDKKKSIETLNFLLSLNLITDEDNALKQILSDSSKINTVPATLNEKYLVTVTDSLNIPVKGLEVYYNQIFIGQTNNVGQVVVGFSGNDLENNDIEVKKDGIECGYIDISVDRYNNIILRIKDKQSNIIN